MREFDESEALRYMSEALSEAREGEMQEDDLYLILDSVWDYYDEKGFLDLNDDSDANLETDDLAAYVVKALKRAGSPESGNPDRIRTAILGELSYEKELDKDF